MSKEAAIEKIMNNLEEEIENILLTELSESRADWLMADVGHIIYSHLMNDIMKVIDE